MADIRLGRCGHVRCEPNWSLDETFSRYLTDCDLWYVWDGEGKMQLADREIALHAGVCLWMRPGGRYLAQHDPANPLGVTFLHFTPLNERGKTYPNADLPAEVFRVRDPRYFSVVLQQIIRLSRQSADPQSTEPGPAEWLFRALIHDLLEGAESTENAVWGQYRARIEGQAARIYEQPGQAPTVSQLAREASLSPDHYGRVFRQIIGLSPRALIQKARLERACQLLRETPLSVSEIAEQCGYADVFQFSRMFKQSRNVPPSQWRK